jgi:hypothetical protein
MEYAQHCSDDDLVLHYYRDAEAPVHAAAHVAGCDECRTRYAELVDSLRLVVLPEPPEVGERYGSELWYRLEPHLAEHQPFWRGWFRPLSFAAAALLLVIAGYTAGRVSPPSPAPDAVQAIDADESRRVLLMSIADHLERSDRVLTDLAHASFSDDISAERQWAADLVADNRFFRQDALDGGEPSVAAVLDELERALLDIVHSPSDATPADLEEVHQRLDSAALLFKVRVLSRDLRQRQREPHPAVDDSPSPSRIS